MAKTNLKEKALLLRKSGNSIKSIADSLSVSKSTVSVWCKNIALSDQAIQRIAKNGNTSAIKALMKYSEAKRKERQKAEKLSSDQGSQKVLKLSSRDIYCIGLGLYWGEGYKQGSQEFGFTNSDPRMIEFYVKWLKVVFSVDKKDLILRVSINSLHSNRINDVQLFWSNLLSIPLTQFSKPSLITTKSRKVYADSTKHMGTLRIKVRKGTAMRREVLGAIKSIR